MSIFKVSASFFATAITVRNDLGVLIGSVAPVAIPGLPPVSPLSPTLHFVGWAHDWDDTASGESEYLPMCIGVSDDWHELVSEIEKRARDAQN